MHFSEERQVLEATELVFRCVSCRNTNSVDAFEFKTEDKWFGVVNIKTTYETSLMCPNCNAAFRTQCKLDELRSLTPEEVGDRFGLRIELVEKFLVVAGWLLFFTGPLAFILFLIAWFMLPKSRSRWRTAAVIGLIVSPIAFGVLYLFERVAF